jgi:hypothetical protein
VGTSPDGADPMPKSGGSPIVIGPGVIALKPTPGDR